MGETIGKYDVNVSPDWCSWLITDNCESDVDGAVNPAAYRLDNKGQDDIRNATKDPHDTMEQFQAKLAAGTVRWVGVKVDSNNQPIDDGNGNLISATALSWPDGTAIDANRVCYFSPGTKAMATMGLVKGDLVWIVDFQNQTQVGAIIGDVGGGNKLHEGSKETWQSLGYDGDPRGHGTMPTPGSIAVVAFPSSASDPPWPNTSYQVDAQQLFVNGGGLSRLAGEVGKSNDFPDDVLSGFTVAADNSSRTKLILAVAAAAAAVVLVAILIEVA